VFLDGDYGDAGWHRALVARADLVLAADGGARFLVGIGVTPDVVVGDFDSLDEDSVVHLEADGVELVRHPVRKDVTDGELAVDEALRRGAGEILMAGATGALDHTLGHLAILRRLTVRGVVARLVAPHLTVAVLQAPSEVTLDAPAGTRVSLVPLGEDAMVSLAGLEYPLDHGILPVEGCIGLGNHLTGTMRGTIDVHAGVVAALIGAEESFGSRTSQETS
jgi:thiamine pyrophosphokinase